MLRILRSYQWIIAAYADEDDGLWGFCDPFITVNDAHDGRIWTEVLHNTLKQSVQHKYLKIFRQTFFNSYFSWGQGFNIQENMINHLEAIGAKM